MSTMLSRICSVVLAVGLLAAGMAAQPSIAATLPQDGIPGQSDVDGVTLGNPADGIGGWGAMAGGVASRPFIKRLSVWRGGVETVVIDNPTGNSNPTPVGGTNIDAVVTPYNLCAPGHTTNCYTTPNRVALSIGYVKDGQIHVDFDSLDDTANIDSTTVFDVTLGLNTLGRSLRWSWLTGKPSYWKIDNIGAQSAELHAKFTPLQVPVLVSGGGCSQIPVQATCPASSANGYFRTASLLLSLDTTLSSAFTGSLFATDRAYIGSLDVAPGPSPQLTYGIAAPATVDSLPNQARLWAFLSDATLLNTFQVPPGAGEPRGIFALDVTAGSLGSDPWDQWTDTNNGTAGWLISSPRITVPLASASAPLANQMVRQAAASRAILMRMKPRVAAASVTMKRASGYLTTTVITGRSAKGSFRVVVSKVTSSKLGKVQRITSASWTQANGKVTRSVRVVSSKIPKKTRVTVLVQRKVGTSWTFFSSATRTAP